MIGRTLDVSTGWTVGKSGLWQVMLLKAGPRTSTLGIYWDSRLHAKLSVKKGACEMVPMTSSVAIGVRYSGCKSDGRGIVSVGVWVGSVEDNNPRGTYPITFTDWSE